MGKTQNKIKVLIEIEVHSTEEKLVLHALDVIHDEIDAKISQSKYIELTPGVHLRQITNMYSYSINIVNP